MSQRREKYSGLGKRWQQQQQQIKKNKETKPLGGTEFGQITATFGSTLNVLSLGFLSVPPCLTHTLNGPGCSGFSS